MHGRIKVRTTEEQRILKEKENAKKLAAYSLGMKQVLSSRKSGIFDPHAFKMCSQLLLSNPDIYTLWNYRKEVILLRIKKSSCDDSEHQDSVDKEVIEEKDVTVEENRVVDKEKEAIDFLEAELKLTEQGLLTNPKSYCCWHHRYWVLLNHPKPNWENELSLCTKYLSMDDRNFHCWDYRRLILGKVEVPLENEIKFSTERINNNFSNYSSWHYRSTLRELDDTCIDSELELIQNAVFTDPADSSTWFYLRWVLSNSKITEQKKQELLDSFNQLQELEPNCKWVLMAKCWLTGSLCLSDETRKDNRKSMYEELIKLDPLRRGQYKDYLLKQVREN